MGKTAKFIFGAIVGATAAALLTPVTGKRARKEALKIAKKVGIDTDKLDSAADLLIKKGEEIFEKPKELVLKKKTSVKSKSKK
jgi:gas vesicle protein